MLDEDPDKEEAAAEEEDEGAMLIESQRVIQALQKLCMQLAVIHVTGILYSERQMAQVKSSSSCSSCSSCSSSWWTLLFLFFVLCLWTALSSLV